MARKPQDNPQLDMTPMIDVVFELIIFFVVTIKQEDLYSRLNVNRPAPSPASSTETKEDISVEIEVGPDNYRSANGIILLNQRLVTREALDKNLREIAQASKKTPVIVRCNTQSPHKALVDVLDICYKNELFSVSVFSM